VKRTEHLAGDAECRSTLPRAGDEAHDGDVRFEINHHFRSDLAKVFAAYTTPEVVTAKYESLGHRNVEILEHDDEGGPVRIRSRRLVPLDVPGFAKRVLSPTNTVEQTDTWTAADDSGARTGTFTVAAKGVPADVSGTLRLVNVPDGGTAMTIAGDVECRVPLVGGKIADFLGSTVKKTIEGEHRFTLGYLGES